MLENVRSLSRVSDVIGHVSKASRCTGRDNLKYTKSNGEEFWHRITNGDWLLRTLEEIQWDETKWSKPDSKVKFNSKT